MSDIKQTQRADSMIHFHKVVDDVFDDVAAGVAEEITAIKTQVSQIESLLKDAIGSLHDSFDGISTESSGQMNILTSLMQQTVGQHDDTPNIFQRTVRAGDILKHLIEMLIDNSRGSFKALEAMGSLQAHMIKAEKEQASSKSFLDDMSALLKVDGEVDKVAMQKLLDDSMTRHDRKSALLEQVHAELTKSHKLIQKIASRDMDDVYSSKAEVEELMQHLYEINTFISGSRVEVTESNGRMRHHLGVAIRGLQFEDITTQSLGHTRLHLERMEGFVLRMTQGLSDINPSEEDGVSGYADKILAIHAEMLNYKQSLALDEKNPVSQQNLDEGDIDLF
ncbi:MAG: hypothetical protein R8K49_09280 [Mariprofundaceae bacterium]